MDESAEEKNVEILKKLSSSLLPIAKRHEGYKTMWKICCDINDSELLRSLMVLIRLFTLLCISYFVIHSTTSKFYDRSTLLLMPYVASAVTRVIIDILLITIMQ